ncbi:MAG: hypothetical protein CM15mP74_19370 [Halieaceae bacterium]|nr:MAG: hypothetical protein CM15mP74_19370 [Halieaceae bacterium]
MGAHILERTEHSVTATLRLSKGGISHGFTTQNTLKRPECMELKLIEGPFEAFSGHWVFRPLGRAPVKRRCVSSLSLPADSPAWPSGNYSIKLHSIWWTP